MDKIAADNLSRLVAVLFFLLVLPARAMEPAGSSFDTMLERLSEESGYAFEVFGEKPGDEVRITSNDDSTLGVKDRLRRILYKAGVTGYILQHDEAGKVMQVVITEIGLPGEQNRTAFGEREELTQGELERIKQAHREKMANLPDDSVIDPPSEYGPGLTLGQLKTIKEEYRENRQMETEETEIMPASEYGNSLAGKELEDIKEQHRDSLKMRSDAEPILPASDYGPEMTEIELDTIKQEYQARLDARTDTSEIMPASEYGPSLTLGELKAIKAEHRSRNNIASERGSAASSDDQDSDSHAVPMFPQDSM